MAETATFKVKMPTSRHGPVLVFFRAVAKSCGGSLTVEQRLSEQKEGWSQLNMTAVEKSARFVAQFEESVRLALAAKSGEDVVYKDIKMPCVPGLIVERVETEYSRR